MSITQFNFRPFSRSLGQGAIVGSIQDQVNFNGNGDNVIIAAIPGRKIKVHKLLIVGSEKTNIRFYSNPSPTTPISGQMNFKGNWGMTLDSDDFTLTTNPGQSLILNSSNVIQVGGWIVYSLV